MRPSREPMNEIARIRRIRSAATCPWWMGRRRCRAAPSTRPTSSQPRDAGGAHLPQPLRARGDPRGRYRRRRPRLPGVLAIVTGADCDKTFGVLPIARSEHPLARDKVRYKGEPVAAVAAIDEATAEKAIRLITHEGARAAGLFHGAARRMAPDAVPLHEKKPGNLERDVHVRARQRRRRLRRGRAGARGHLQLRRGVPEPDGDARRGRRLRRACATASPCTPPPRCPTTCT